MCSMRFKTMAIALLVTVILVFSVNAEEEKKPEKKLPLKKLPKIEAVTIRFPEAGYLIVPKSAHSLEVKCTAWNENTELYEYKDTNTMDKPVRISNKPRVNVKDLAGKKLFVLIHFLPRDNSEFKVRSFAFLDEFEETMEPKTRRHFVGWFHYPWGGGEMTIVSRAPILGARVQTKSVTGQVSQSSGGSGFPPYFSSSTALRQFRIERISPFIIKVTLSSFSNSSTEVVAGIQLDLDAAYELGGALYYWKPDSTAIRGRSIHIPFTARYSRRGVPIPSATSRIVILINSRVVSHRFPSCHLSLFINEDTTPKQLNTIDKERKTTCEKVEEEIGGKKLPCNRISMNIKWHKSSLKKLEGVKEGQLRLYLQFYADPFFCGNIETEILKFIHTVRFYDAEGKLLADWAKDGVEFRNKPKK